MRFLVCQVDWPRFLFLLLATSAGLARAEDSTVQFALRWQTKQEASDDRYQPQTETQSWSAKATAVIVCDVWDYHHCYNAVGRIQQFAPRLDQVLAEMRNRGATIIHAPSDCMKAYRDHPARHRAIAAPLADDAPIGIDQWCSSIPTEELAEYPIDQSDGGEDDDPAEHQRWAKKLESLGRNPNQPWQQQTDLLAIDPVTDYISDRGEEVWNVLQAREITHVILVGVHTNMCVLGRPFGLRQMVRGGKQVVLMRDMTDTMYNPDRWPYVSHFEGTRRIIDHIERYVCPTISSDQIIGGDEFQFAGDNGRREPDGQLADPHRTWTMVTIPDQASTAEGDRHWYRCVLKVPANWSGGRLTECDGSRVWINGNELNADQDGAFEITADAIDAGDANLLVVCTGQNRMTRPPELGDQTESLALAGKWQLRIGEDPKFRNMPLPAKFGAGSDIVFSVP